MPASSRPASSRPPSSTVRPRLGILAASALLALALTTGPALAQPAAPPLPPPSAPAAAPLPSDPAAIWAVNFERATLLAEPNAEAESLGSLRENTYLQVLGYEDTWAKVFNPRTRATAFIQSDLLGPTDVPPAYIASPPPPTLQEINLPGRVVKEAALTFFPTLDPEAQTGALPHNAPVFVVDSVVGDEGQEWYRTPDGDYLSPSSVQLPPPPPRVFSGRWIDVNLNTPVTLTAYEGDRVVMTSLAIKGVGASQTPTGLFSIQRRVANETMNSETIGIPRFATGGYYLTNVLYTQYFLGSGEAIHYNYWSSVWGYAGSRGCLGLPLAESEFIWNFATVGTPINIHY